MIPSSDWRPFADQELSLAEYARQVTERFDFDVRVGETGLTGDLVGRRPGIIVIDPQFIADQAGREALAQVAAKLPRWVLPLVVVDRPDDARTKTLAEDVFDILAKAKALPTESARRGAHGVVSLDAFVAIVPVLVAEAGKQYLRRSSRVLSPREVPDMTAEQRRGAGQIITFYSFKGGTGRTMALANVAWILAANGLRVLIADWDLESPGLHRFFQPFMDPHVSERPGIVDFVRKYEWAADAADITPQALLSGPEDAQRDAREKVERLIAEHVTQLDAYTISLDWEFQDSGALHFLSPGKQTNVYSPTLSGLEWDVFYNTLHGGQFFDALREHLKRDYDYVLIDSRTGLSDMSDICTVHLPDTVVDCFTLSTQGIEGAGAMAQTIRTASSRPITIWPVPMRIDHSREERVAAGLEFVEKKLAGLPVGMKREQRQAYWGEVEVPYKPSYAYEETLAVFGDRPGSMDSLLSAYERITARITGGTVTALPPREEWLRLRTRLKFSRTSEAASPLEVALYFTPEDQLWAEWIAAVLASPASRLSGLVRRLTRAQSPTCPPRRSWWCQSPTSATCGTFPHPCSPTCLSPWMSYRIPSSSHLSEVPALFLAGRTEAEAIALLAGRPAASGRRNRDRPTWRCAIPALSTSRSSACQRGMPTSPAVRRTCGTCATCSCPGE